MVRILIPIRPSRLVASLPTTAQCHLTSPLGQKAHSNVGPTPPLTNGERGPTPARMNGDDECPPQHAQTVTTSAHLSMYGTLVSKQTWAQDDEQMQAQADQRMNGDVGP